MHSTQALECATASEAGTCKLQVAHLNMSPSRAEQGAAPAGPGGTSTSRGDTTRAVEGKRCAGGSAGRFEHRPQAAPPSHLLALAAVSEANVSADGYHSVTMGESGGVDDAGMQPRERRLALAGDPRGVEKPPEAPARGDGTTSSGGAALPAAVGERAAVA